MSGANRPVTSHEYKLMLNVDRFDDRERGSGTFWSLVRFLAERHGGEIVERQNEVKRRRTWYLDTAGFALRLRGFILRVREEYNEKKPYKITLKHRAPDRYVSAAQDVSCSKDAECKFEEDIIPPFTSKFAHSTTVRRKHEPDLSDMVKVVALFPGLGDLEIDDNTPFESVNGFEATEAVHRLGKIKFCVFR